MTFSELIGVLRKILHELNYDEEVTEQDKDKLCDAIYELEKYDTVRDPKSITDEEAIDRLHRSGWMAKHDASLRCASLLDIVNAMMIDGNKSISVNIYPWKEDGNETT